MRSASSTVLVALLFSIPYLGRAAAAPRASCSTCLTITEASPSGIDVGQHGHVGPLSSWCLSNVASGGLSAPWPTWTPCSASCWGWASSSPVLSRSTRHRRMGGAINEGFAGLAASATWANGAPPATMEAGRLQRLLRNPGGHSVHRGPGQRKPRSAALGPASWCLTYMFALHGHPVRPGVFHVVVRQHRAAKPFAPQQVWASSFCDRPDPVLLHRFPGHGRAPCWAPTRR